MVFIDLWFTLSCNTPLWVIDGNNCTRYASKVDTPDEYDRKYVDYITIGDNGELTVEIFGGVK